MGLIPNLIRMLQPFVHLLPTLAPWLIAIAAIALVWFFGRQLQHPSGSFGRNIMAGAFNNGNRKLLDTALLCLDAKPGERIADIGFGGGYAIDQLLPKVEPARPIGVDVSEMMVDLGNEAWDDLVEVYLAAADHMPISTDSVDGVLTVNTIYFWRDPVASFKEIRRILKPEGRVIIGFRKAWALRLLPFTWFRFRYYSEERLTKVLKKAGFEVRFEEAPGGVIAIAKPYRG